ncbi:heme peroxidase [Mycena galericulata]|nr:heme peroxidase [Mycena galericulata]
MLSSLAILILLESTSAYIWPSPQLYALESARFDQEGFNAGGLAALIQPCLVWRVHPADLTQAFHDMATYNITDGTGGLDASIRFVEEQERPENAGNEFGDTVVEIHLQVNRYVSTLATVIALENWHFVCWYPSLRLLKCGGVASGGPEIAFRGGRVDAGEPNAPGVPQPQDELQTHIADFSRMGFTQTEMIGLVACGAHTFGGVQHDTFPDNVNVLNDPNSSEDVAHFDSTSIQPSAAEYIAGTTQNPLVVGFNDTTNSDKPILASDGNATMRSFANSMDLYASTCADLYARMLNTVPSGVQLTDMITPLPVKPSNVVLSMAGDILKVSCSVRLWNMPEDANVHCVYALGRPCRFRGYKKLPPRLCGRFLLLLAGVTARCGTGSMRRMKPTLYLDPAAGITSLSFVVNGTLEDQGGIGFAIQDSFMLSETSCKIEDPFTGRMDVAVRAALYICSRVVMSEEFQVRNGVNPTRVYLEEVTTDRVSRPIIVEIDITPPAEPVAANSAYSLWSINLTDPNTFYSIGAEIDGVQYSTNDQHTFNEFPICPTS